MKKNKIKGFSLIEVLIFISVFSIFFIVAIAAVTMSLRNMKINEHRIIALHYAQELQEWLKTEKEIDWNEFLNRTSGTYCFNSQLSLARIWPALGACNDFSGIVGLPPLIFKRELIFTKNTNQVMTAINVSWREFNQVYSVKFNNTFNPWE